ncbi:hypothetical protein D3C80_1433890 [compost metagenome]
MGCHHERAVRRITVVVSAGDIDREVQVAGRFLLYIGKFGEGGVQRTAFRSRQGNRVEGVPVKACEVVGQNLHGVSARYDGVSLRSLMHNTMVVGIGGDDIDATANLKPCNAQRDFIHQDSVVLSIGERHREAFFGREVVVTHPQPIADVDRRLPFGSGQGRESGRYATVEFDGQGRSIAGFDIAQVERIPATGTLGILGDGVVPVRPQGNREHLGGTVEDFDRGAACIGLAGPA